MENVFDDNHNVQLYKQFYKTQNLAVKQVLNSNLSLSDKLNSLLDMMLVEYKCNNDIKSFIAIYYDLKYYGISLGPNIKNFVNKDKIDNRVSGKIIYHGKFDENKCYKLLRIKRTYSHNRDISLYKATNLTDYDVRQIGQDMINNITFDKIVCSKRPLTRTDTKTYPCISYKYIGTNTTNGIKKYWYVLKVAINYSNKPAFVAILKQQGEKAVQNAVNYVTARNAQYNKGYIN